jgi:hypothetical protein
MEKPQCAPATCRPCPGSAALPMLSGAASSASPGRPGRTGPQAPVPLGTSAVTELIAAERSRLYAISGAATSMITISAIDRSRPAISGLAAEAVLYFRRTAGRPGNGTMQYRAGLPAGEPFRAQRRRIARCGC